MTASAVSQSQTPTDESSFDHLPDHVAGWIESVVDDPAVVQGLKGFENLRPYQSEAVLAAAARVRKTKDPLLITLPTGAGKSWVIAALASVVRNMATANTGKRKKVLVLVHSKELVQQNYLKMREAGYHATVYAAGLQQRDGSGDIVFGSRQTVVNAVEEFAELDYEFSAVFIDEAHSVPKQTRDILDALRAINPNLRVIGLTATPYALGKGYIFAQDTFRGLPPLREVYTRAPFFAERVYDKCPHELIDEGYLCPPMLGTISDAYDTRGLERSAGGSFTEASSNAVFVKGQGDLTKRIVKEVKDKAKTRKGVMFFAQTREHARQILSFLPKKQSALIDSGTKDRDRDRLIDEFKRRKLKYLVTVAALATGFDAPGVDLIAVLRHTESQAFFQQIIGRGLRLCPETGKRNCLVLDYAQNLAPDGDLFTPVIELGEPGGARHVPMVDVICPDCGGENRFRKASWPQDTTMTDTGFLVDTNKHTLLMSRDKKPVAGHMGVQCGNLLERPGADRLTRCGFTWGAVICPRCERRNSHRTDFCLACEAPLSRRAQILTLTASRDETYAHRLARVVSQSRYWLYAGKSSRAGEPTLRISLTIQELPYLEPADAPRRGRPSKEESEEPNRDEWVPAGLKLVRPEPFAMVAWLNPTIKNRGAQTAWAAFTEYAKSHQQAQGKWDQYQDWDSLLKALENPNSDLRFARPNYLVYQKKTLADGEKVFYNPISFHYQHPDIKDIGEPVERDQVDVKQIMKAVDAI
ncbi:DEAD/DEAH box helicase [Marinobacter subterrani]|uniref:DEAD/DEAH box helicase n=1 Tax=Marinobacter subterrani TaxID=1658765 RepID=UPI002357DF33|nr:DEAD/DEAH box helicase [Marinobacter subterrani]